MLLQLDLKNSALEANDSTEKQRNRKSLVFGFRDPRICDQNGIFCDIKCAFEWPDRDYYVQHFATPQIIPDL